MSRLALASAVALTTAEAGTLKLTYSDCGSKHGKVTSMSPTSFSTGAKVTITGTGTIDEDITSASLKATVSALGTQLTSCSGDGTKDIVCELPLNTGSITVPALTFPLKAGTLNLPVLVETTPSIPPSLASVDIHLTGDDQNGESAICLDAHTDGSVSSSDDRSKYAEWQAAFGSNGGEEEFQVFQSNLRLIEQMQVDDPSATYSHMTPFANISPEEFKGRNGYRATQGATKAPLLDASNLASSLDWRTQGAVNPIKDQGQCGSCWAFSTVANIEGAGFVETGKLLNLSEQQLVDCDTADSGCNGGLPSNAFEYMISNSMGLEGESAYPYTAKDGSCHDSKSQEQAFITAWQQISTDETQIATALQQYGPLSIGINANTLQFYTGGVSNPSKILCNPAALDHGVAIVGFGSDSGQDYWTIRNSWGSSWGEAGYFRMVRGTGACGLNSDVTTATGISTVSSVQV
jgi:cathepsin F